MYFTKFIATLFLTISSGINAFSPNCSNNNNNNNVDSRRGFIQQIGIATTAATIGVTTIPVPAVVQAAGPEILKTTSGVKYAVTKPVGKGLAPQQGDIVAIEYTGYLSNGEVSFGIVRC